MLPLVGDINIIKDVIFPIGIGFLTTYAYKRFGHLLKSSRNSAARKRIEKDIKTLMVVIASNYGGGFNSLLTLKVTHLIVRCAVFLWAFTAVMAFFVLSEVKGGSAYNYQLIALSICTGVIFNMIRTIWDDIHDLSMVHANPVAYAADIQERVNAVGATDFQERLDRTKQLAHDMDLQRRGRASAEILIGKLIFERSDAAAENKGGEASPEASEASVQHQ